ncbi:MAG TPA: GMC family oxidoreductase, partial [Anaerolineales bacterium]|nr:GMC family oxidoreductase [Anaerolineales bacterium]
APAPHLHNLQAIPPKLTCDVVIVGSGAGGGVVAELLAKAGYSVIVLEKGGAYQPHNFPTHEYPAFRNLYEHAGLLTTADASLSVLAGSTLGGGTTINWMACLHTPAEVLEEWKRDFGLSDLAEGAIQRAADTVAAQLQIAWQGAPRNPQQEALWQASQALGHKVSMVGWNSGGCAATHCSWCGFGCRHDHKNSTAKTYLASAQMHGAQIVTDCFVKQVTVRNGKATGVLAEIQQGGQTLPLTISAQRVVLAGGAIHSPLILKRTGLNNPNIGRHLRLHPVTAARGEFSHPIEMWNGAMLTVVNSQFANLDGKGYGVRIENPPAHPGLLGSALPWLNGKQHKAQMLRMANQAAFISLARDVGSGRVTLNSAGKPRLDYPVSQADKRHLLVGIQESLRLLRVAGAGELGTLQSGLPALPAGASDAQFSAWLEQVARIGLRPNAVGMFSAHQMGTCRMTGNRASGVVKPSGESWEVAGLFVADASLFPTASGVNPMLTIMAMAHCVGEEMLNDLKK